MRSDMPLADWRGDVTMFAGQLHTTPAYEERGITAAALAGLICPKEPFMTSDKSRAPYALPSDLKTAPLVSKTLVRAIAAGLPTVGTMRSASHVIDGAWLKLDLDGVSKDETRNLITRLDDEKLGYLLYSTHSHGFKPRNRLRLVLFLDRALPAAEYKRASHGAAVWLLGESLDSSEGGLHQLAGAYMRHPDRKAKTFRLVDISGERCCVSADALLALVPEAAKSNAYSPTPAPAIFKGKIGDALRWIDPNDTHTWVQVGMALKAIEGELGADALGHWLSFSESAGDAAKTNNNDDRYNPLTMWDSFSPSMPADAAMGRILGLGRDGAGVALTKSLASEELDNRGREAVVYLEQRHPRFLSSILAGAGIGGDA